MSCSCSGVTAGAVKLFMSHTTLAATNSLDQLLPPGGMSLRKALVLLNMVFGSSGKGLSTTWIKKKKIGFNQYAPLVDRPVIGWCAESSSNYCLCPKNSLSSALALLWNNSITHKHQICRSKPKTTSSFGTNVECVCAGHGERKITVYCRDYHMNCLFWFFIRLVLCGVALGNIGQMLTGRLMF